MKLLNAELYAICVLEPYQGSHSADHLYEGLCCYFKKLEIDAFMIVVGANLQRAQRFYTKRGAIPIGVLNRIWKEIHIIQASTLSINAKPNFL